MTENPTPIACDLCTVVLVVDHDPAGRTIVRIVHQAGCPEATPTINIARTNT
jgi:hypothetical protein